MGDGQKLSVSSATQLKECDPTESNLPARWILGQGGSAKKTVAVTPTTANGHPAETDRLANKTDRHAKTGRLGGGPVRGRGNPAEMTDQINDRNTTLAQLACAH